MLSLLGKREPVGSTLRRGSIYKKRFDSGSKIRRSVFTPRSAELANLAISVSESS
jgi:hypothetical protein